MYEALLKQPVRVKVEAEHHKIDTLRFERIYPESLVMQENSDSLREVISRCFASSLDKYIDYDAEFDQSGNMCRISGEIKVVDRV